MIIFLCLTINTTECSRRSFDQYRFQLSDANSTKHMKQRSLEQLHHKIVAELDTNRLVIRQYIHSGSPEARKTLEKYLAIARTLGYEIDAVGAHLKSYKDFFNSFYSREIITVRPIGGRQ